MRWPRVLGVVTIASVVLVVPALAQPQPSEPPVEPTEPTETPAQVAFREGRALLDEGKPVEACARFEASIKDDPDAPGTMLNLGLCNEQLGKTATALRWFRKAQFRSAESGMTDYENAAKGKTLALAPTVPIIRITFAHPAPDATVTLDGETVSETDVPRLEVDPGSHVVEMRQPGKNPLRAEFTITSGEQKTVTMPVPAPPKTYVDVDRGANRRLLAYVLAGTGLALWGGSLTISLVGKSKYDELEHPVDQQKWINIVRFGGTSMFVAGTAAVATGVFLYVRAPSKERVEKTAIAPALGPNHVGVAVHGSF